MVIYHGNTLASPNIVSQTLVQYQTWERSLPLYRPTTSTTTHLSRASSGLSLKMPGLELDESDQWLFDIVMVCLHALLFKYWMMDLNCNKPGDIPCRLIEQS